LRPALLSIFSMKSSPFHLAIQCVCSFLGEWSMLPGKVACCQAQAKQPGTDAGESLDFDRAANLQFFVGAHPCRRG
jgi:hypothetical protein